MGLNSIQAAFETLKEEPFGDVGATYTVLGSALSTDAYALVFSNGLDKDAYISFDGSNNHIYLASGQVLEVNFGSNKQLHGALVFPNGTQIYQKRGPGGASASGILSCTVLYAS